MKQTQKHILFISSWYPNRNRPSHGIFNRHFAEVVATKNKVTVLHVCSEEHLKANFELTELQEENLFTLIVYYKKIKTTLPFISHYLKRKRLIRAFEIGFMRLRDKTGTPDLIQLNVVLPAGIGAQYLSKKYNIPYVINEGWTGYMPEDGSYKGWMQKLITKKIVSGAKVLMPVSADLQRDMEDQGLEGHYRIVPNVVNCEAFRPEPTIKKDGTRFIHISTLDAGQKNVSGILRAFHMASETVQNLKLIIVGEGKEKPQLQALAKALKIESKVEFKGQLIQKQIVNEINAVDALLMFSNYESFCVVIGEALSCGKPVITSRVGGLTADISPELGITVTKQNEAELSNALIQFSQTKNNYDPNFIRSYALEHFDKTAIAEQLNAIYNEVLSQKNE